MASIVRGEWVVAPRFHTAELKTKVKGRKIYVGNGSKVARIDEHGLCKNILPAHEFRFVAGTIEKSYPAKVNTSYFMPKWYYKRLRLYSSYMEMRKIRPRTLQCGINGMWIWDAEGWPLLVECRSARDWNGYVYVPINQIYSFAPTCLWSNDNG